MATVNVLSKLKEAMPYICYIFCDVVAFVLVKDASQHLHGSCVYAVNAFIHSIACIGSVNALGIYLIASVMSGILELAYFANHADWVMMYILREYGITTVTGNVYNSCFSMVIATFVIVKVLLWQNARLAFAKRLASGFQHLATTKPSEAATKDLGTA